MCAEMLESELTHFPRLWVTGLAITSLPLPPLLRSIPKSAILSSKTTACAEMLESERLGGGLGLTVAVMYERAIGKKSKW